MKIITFTYLFLYIYNVNYPQLLKFLLVLLMNTVMNTLLCKMRELFSYWTCFESSRLVMLQCEVFL